LVNRFDLLGRVGRLFRQGDHHTYHLPPTKMHNDTLPDQDRFVVLIIKHPIQGDVQRHMQPERSGACRCRNSVRSGGHGWWFKKGLAWLKA
jgi:hypothetical protein